MKNSNAKMNSTVACGATVPLPFVELCSLWVSLDLCPQFSGYRIKEASGSLLVSGEDKRIWQQSMPPSLPSSWFSLGLPSHCPVPLFQCPPKASPPASVAIHSTTFVFVMLRPMLSGVGLSSATTSTPLAQTCPIALLRWQLAQKCDIC